MPPEQATEFAKEALQAPINNLIAFGIILSLVIVLGVGFLAWKFVPVLLRQIQQQLETNAKLTKILEQNSNQAILAAQSVEKNTAETAKQTAVIDAHTTQLEANTATVAALKVSTETLTASTEDLKKQVQTLIDDKAACAGIEETINQVKQEILQAMREQAAKKTSEQHTVNLPPATHDNGAAGQATRDEAA